MPKPKYTWETVKSDPAARDELFRIVGELQKGLKLTTGEARTLNQSKDEGLKYSVPQSAARVAKTLETMKKLMERGDECRPDFEDCMANLSSTLSRVQKALPDKYQSPGAIKGFGDLSASADALLPEPGTAGHCALKIQDYIWGIGTSPKELFGLPKYMPFFQYMALEKTTRGAKDWRKVPADHEAHRARAEQLNQVFGDALFSAADNFDRKKEPGKDDPMILSSPGRHEPEQFITERMGLNMQENQKN